jgi:hypothetical protein
MIHDETNTVPGELMVKIVQYFKPHPKFDSIDWADIFNRPHWVFWQITNRLEVDQVRELGMCCARVVGSDGGGTFGLKAGCLWHMSADQKARGLVMLIDKMEQAAKPIV